MVKKITKVEIAKLYVNGYDSRYYAREMAALLKKPHQTIKPYAEALVNEGILIKKERGKITEYSLNFKDKKVYDYLTIAEKEKLMALLREDRLLSVLFEKLSQFFGRGTFTIFGSAVEGTSKAADIDLLVIGSVNVSHVIDDFEKVYNKQVHKIQVVAIEKLTAALIREIYKKHLILNNTEQVVRFFGALYEQNKLV